MVCELVKGVLFVSARLWCALSCIKWMHTQSLSRQNKHTHIHTHFQGKMHKCMCWSNMSQTHWIEEKALKQKLSLHRSIHLSVSFFLSHFFLSSLMIDIQWHIKCSACTFRFEVEDASPISTSACAEQTSVLLLMNHGSQLTDATVVF